MHVPKHVYSYIESLQRCLLVTIVSNLQYCFEVHSTALWMCYGYNGLSISCIRCLLVSTCFVLGVFLQMNMVGERWNSLDCKLPYVIMPVRPSHPIASVYAFPTCPNRVYVSNNKRKIFEIATWFLFFRLFTLFQTLFCIFANYCVTSDGRCLSMIAMDDDCHR